MIEASGWIRIGRLIISVAQQEQDARRAAPIICRRDLWWKDGRKHPAVGIRGRRDPRGWYRPLLIGWRRKED